MIRFWYNAYKDLFTQGCSHVSVLTRFFLFCSCYMFDSQFDIFFQGLKNQARVKLNIVRCPPVTTVLIRRPDLRYQLGFSVQNGIVSSFYCFWPSFNTHETSSPFVVKFQCEKREAAVFSFTASRIGQVWDIKVLIRGFVFDSTYFTNLQSDRWIKKLLQLKKPKMCGRVCFQHASYMSLAKPLHDLKRKSLFSILFCFKASA